MAGAHEPLEEKVARVAGATRRAGHIASVAGRPGGRSETIDETAAIGTAARVDPARPDEVAGRFERGARPGARPG